VQPLVVIKVLNQMTQDAQFERLFQRCIEQITDR